MARRSHTPVEVLIEKVDYPNRSRGVILETREYDEVDRFLEIENDYKRRGKGAKTVAKGGIEGQIYRAIKKRTRDGAKEVKYLELIERSPLEKKSQCKTSDICGGCSYQTLPYETELLIKRDQITRLFSSVDIKDRLGKPINVSMYRSPSEVGYRNKMEYTFGDSEKGGELKLGLHRPNHFYEIVETPECNIVPNDFNLLRKEIQSFFIEKGISYYHRAKKEGTLRHCVLRASITKKELMINLVTTSSEDITRELLLDFIRKMKGLQTEFELVSIFHTTNDAASDAVIPEKLELLYGREYLVEELHGLTFHVGPFSFFQPNVLGASNLYQQAISFAGDLTGKTVYDLYCGTGTITQLIAKKAQRVIGIEIVEEAVEKAKESAELNHIVNAKFIAGDVLKELDTLVEHEDYPEVITIDPPRDGIHPKALPKIIAAKPDKIIYISCNPRTLVRDILEFNKGGYAVDRVVAFDQFSRTCHVECIALIQRVKS